MNLNDNTKLVDAHCRLADSTKESSKYMKKLNKKRKAIEVQESKLTKLRDEEQSLQELIVIKHSEQERIYDEIEQLNNSTKRQKTEEKELHDAITTDHLTETDEDDDYHDYGSYVGQFSGFARTSNGFGDFEHTSQNIIDTTGFGTGTFAGFGSSSIEPTTGFTFGSAQQIDETPLKSAFADL
jgi:hypothetical protein